MALGDPPYDAQVAKLDILHEYGTTGLFRFGGRIWEEFLVDLQGPKGIKTYKTMAYNDATISSILYAIEMIIRQVDWRIDPTGGNPEDEDAAEFVESCLFQDMSPGWEETLAEILTMLVYGWSWFEINYKKRNGPNDEDITQNSNFNDGRVGWRNWAIRAQESLYLWHIDDYGGIQGMIQMAPPHYHVQEIPIEKSLLFRVRANKGNPEGRSLLRHAYWSWYVKNNLEQIEAIGVERDLVGMPIMWLPMEIIDGKSTEAQAAKARYTKIIENLTRNEREGILMPMIYDEQGHQMYNLTLLGPGGQRQFSTSEIIDRYDKRIAMTVLADFLFLGQGNTGTYQLAETRNNLFQMSVQTILDAIQEVINSYAIPKLLRLNAFVNPPSLPQLRHGKVGNVNLNDLGNFIANIGRAGIALTDAEQINYVLRQGNIPEELESEGSAQMPKADTLMEPAGQTSSHGTTPVSRQNEEAPTSQPIEDIPGGGRT